MGEYEKRPNNEKLDNTVDRFSILSKLPPFEKWRQRWVQPRSESNPTQPDTDPHKIQSFNKFVDFFKKDNLIKHTLSELAPSPQDFYDPVNYSDELYEGIREISSDIHSIM